MIWIKKHVNIPVELTRDSQQNRLKSVSRFVPSRTDLLTISVAVLCMILSCRENLYQAVRRFNDICECGDKSGVR